MKICFTLPYYNPAYTDPARFFVLAPVMRYLPQAVAALGYQVDAVLAFPTPHDFVEGGVHYHFVPSHPLARTLAQRAGRWLHRDPSTLEPACRALSIIRDLQPDLVHFHGTNLYLNHCLMLAVLPRRRPPIVLHYHGGSPSPNTLARRLQRFNFRRTNRFLFTTHAHARPFIDAGLIDEPGRVVPFMQISTVFQRRGRDKSRRETGMTGNPVCLWVGRLDANKDPMTALRGFEQILAARPEAHWYLYYLTDALLPRLRQYLEARPLLKEHVHFRGRAPFEQMETIFNSADLFLQASRREVAGRAGLEAMACGVIPVVTGIPSFYAMTDGGRYGVLFRPGDAEALARGVLSIPLDEVPERSRQVHAWFEQAFSFPALAKQLDAVYREVFDESG